MKAFLIGLLFIFAVILLTGIGILLMPLLIMLHVFLRALIWLGFAIFAIWLLGKLILFVWKKLNKS